METLQTPVVFYNPTDTGIIKEKSIAELFNDHQEGRAHLWELVYRFLGDHPKKPQTLATYRRNFERFFFWYGESQQPISRQLVKSYRRYLESILLTPENENRAGEKMKDHNGNELPFNTFISPYTATTYLTTVKAFISWLNAEAGIPNFAKKLDAFTNSSVGHSKDILSKDQLMELLTTSQNLRDAALIRLTFICAFRTIEIVRANIGDIRNRDGEHVIYYQKKGSETKNKIKVIPPDTYKLLMRYIATRKTAKPTDPLFVGECNRNNGGRMTTRSVSRIIKETLREAQMISPKLTAHSLRHTAITFAIKEGATPNEAKDLAGHVSFKTTYDTYYHEYQRIENAAEKLLERLVNG